MSQSGDIRQTANTNYAELSGAFFVINHLTNCEHRLLRYARKDGKMQLQAAINDGIGTVPSDTLQFKIAVPSRGIFCISLSIIHPVNS